MIEINGKKFEVCNSDEPYWQWVKQGNFNHEWQTYDRFLKPEHTFIDLGAWIGSHSMYASRVAKRIIAVEPDPVAYTILSANLSLLDNRPETWLYHAAVSNEAGRLTLGSGCLGASTTRKNLEAGNNIGAAVPEHTIEVEAISLRSLLERYEDPLFIKIDIEGMEEDLFKDWQLFEERKPTVFVEMHSWWWLNETEARANFRRLSHKYTLIEEVRPSLYLLEK